MPEIVNGYTLITDWKNAQQSQTAQAEKNGKKYFMKKYTNYVLATKDGMFDEKTIEVKKRKFDSFVYIRRRVLNALRPSAGPGGNIILPNDDFISGIHYYEATEFVNGAIPDDELEDFLASLSYDERLMMMKTAAGALSAIHSAGIIHSDLKLKNVLIAKNSSEKFVAKIIDFDSSYPDDEKKFIGGDEVFASPELMNIIEFEGTKEERQEALKKLTYKTDIFSLGVIFHKYLSGKLPTPDKLTPFMEKRKAVYDRKGMEAVFNAHFILSQGCEIVLDSSIKSISMKSLIMDMLDIDPDKRPTAQQVLKRLKESEEPTIGAPWSDHAITFDIAQLNAAKIVGVRQIMDKDKKYEVRYFTGKKEILSKDQMISKGYAKSKSVAPPPPVFDEPWREHSFTWNKVQLNSRGYTSAKRAEESGVKGYFLGRSTGGGRYFTVDKLIALDYVIKKEGKTPPPPVSDPVGDPDEDKPWPTHNIEFDMATASSKGIKSIKRKELSGKKGYEIERIDGVKKFYLPDMLVVLKYAKKK